jgi:hypothetical protein
VVVTNVWVLIKTIEKYPIPGLTKDA